MSSIVVVHFALSITTLCGLRAGITLSVCNSKSHNTFSSLIFLRALDHVSTVSYLSESHKADIFLLKIAATSLCLLK